jgi:hypothetical protein
MRLEVFASSRIIILRSKLWPDGQSGEELDLPMILYSFDLPGGLHY